MILEYVPDAEAERAAGSLAKIVELAGWKIVKLVPRPDRNIERFDGVTIEFKFIAGAFSPAAEELEDFLLTNKWEATAAWATEEIPENTLRIIVGFKPSLRSDPDWVKKLREESRKNREETKRLRERLESQQKN